MADEKLKEVFISCTRSGKFGQNCEFVDLVPSDIRGADHFASDVSFMVVKLNQDSRERNVHVVIKKQQASPMIWEMMNTKAQFYNEYVMYSEILPFLDTPFKKNSVMNETFPKFIHGKATYGENYEEDILVMEDMLQYKYKLTEERLLLDFQHCKLAFEKLGRFHALSYMMKHNNPDEFFMNVNKLKEVRYVAGNKAESNDFLTKSVPRGIFPLLEAGKYVEECVKLKEQLEDPFSLMSNLCRPVEPNAVLCHGDFCRNNMVFRYDSPGHPQDVVFYDLGTTRYASPAIDLSFFLFLNTTRELRRAHLDVLLDLYHTALASTASPAPVPTLDTVRRELAQHALYGYVLCSFFTGMMLTPQEERNVNSPPDEREHNIKNSGGQLATDLCTDMITDIIEWNKPVA